MKKKNRGFSLIELIIAVAILVILTGLLAPQFMKYIESARRAKIIHELDTIQSAVEMAFTETLGDYADDITGLSNFAYIQGGKPGAQYPIAVEASLLEKSLCENLKSVLGEDKICKLNITLPLVDGEGISIQDVSRMQILYYPDAKDYDDYIELYKLGNYYYLSTLAEDNSIVYGEAQNWKSTPWN